MEDDFARGNSRQLLRLIRLISVSEMNCVTDCSRISDVLHEERFSWLPALSPLSAISPHVPWIVLGDSSSEA